MVATRLKALVDLFYLQQHSQKTIEMQKINRCFKFVAHLLAS